MRHIESIVDLRKFGSLKLLAVYHNVKERFFSNWRTFYIDPPSERFVDFADKNSTEEIRQMLSYCVEKLHTFTSMVYDKGALSEDLSNDMKTQALPECSTIRSIISSAFVMDLNRYFGAYHTLPDYSYSFEKCWPAPFDFTPTLSDNITAATKFVPLLEDILGANVNEESLVQKSQVESSVGGVEIGEIFVEGKEIQKESEENEVVSQQIVVESQKNPVETNSQQIGLKSLEEREAIDIASGINGIEIQGIEKEDEKNETVSRENDV
ncbi:uncharacterized protein LOC143914400 [Arctopsyche grandis]|uniref:uncharacterized protein LOC143914400 n=1 Tax=Arctopsyche grandis TaxID=121162 RepID=UPI00406D6C1A